MKLLARILDWFGRFQTVVWLWSAIGGVLSLAGSTYLRAPEWAILLSVLLGLVVAPVIVISWHHLFSRLGIQFENNAPPSSSFYQSDTVVREREVIAYQLYRIAVQNSKKRQEVMVEIISIDPCPQNLVGRLPLPLQFQHEPGIRSIVLKPGDKKYIDVVMRTFSSETREYRIDIQHTLDWVDRQLPDGVYAIEIKATGDTESDTKKFLIGDIYGEGAFCMNAMDN